ncbi:hypothetical protein O6H91_18G010200 [Diphasiastrum complanatum]|nr:hypothetical protein O6H91_18G010200 [Diphasiastrum complanatum]
MGGQISREKQVIAEEKQLQDLQNQDGTQFPGSDFHTTNYKEWMSALNLGSLKVKDVLWPATHDSATNEIGIPFITRPFAQCQTLSMYEQLVAGVRAFDIRVDNHQHVCHGILESYSVDVVINDIKKFLSETKAEIIIVEFRTEFGYADPTDFDKWLIQQLGQYLVAQDPSVFDKTLEELLPARVICVWKPNKSAAPAPGSPLWSSGYLRDNWTDTDMPKTKFDANMKYLSEQAPNETRQYFYRVENTATPQTSSVVLDVYTVTNRIRGFARLFLSQAFKKGYADRLQIFASDLIASDFIDACIGATVARHST